MEPTNSSSKRHKSKRRRSNTNTKKDYSVYIGIFLVIGGLIMSLYLFDVFSTTSNIFEVSDFELVLRLWPVLIVFLGLFFLLKNYFSTSQFKDWNSKD
jgi:uncharacterized membrane protein (DUF373 family)